MLKFSSPLVTLLGVGALSSVLADSTPEPSWTDDGWRTEFDVAHCYMGQSYDDRSRPEIGIANVNFIQIANQSLAESEYSFPLWNALKSTGLEEDDLVFTIALPGRVSWTGDTLSAYAASLSVNGFEAKKIATKPFFDDWEEQVWFVLGPPESKTLIDTFSAEKPVDFNVILTDGSTVAFKYHSSPDLDFKVRRAMFEACIGTLSPESSTK